MICRDQISEFCRKCNPVPALPRFQSDTWLVFCCLLTDFTTGILRIVSEHIVISCFVGNRWYLSYSWHLCQLISLPHRWLPKEVCHQEVFSSTTSCFVTPSVWSWRRCIVFFHSFRKLLQTDPTWCPPLLFLAQIFLKPTRIQWMVQLYSITFLPLNNMEISPDSHE